MFNGRHFRQSVIQPRELSRLAMMSASDIWRNDSRTGPSRHSNTTQRRQPSDHIWNTLRSSWLKPPGGSGPQR